VDSSVKSYAIQALADRGGDEAVEALQLALRDPDPAVRLQVIDHVAPQDQGLALLQEAFADDDATVRSVAAARLEEAISEGR
jgi:HEAT repeat protein